MFLQVVPDGAYLTCPKPLAALAVMEPLCPVVRSSIVVTRPWAESCRLTLSLSPDPMKRSAARLGVNVSSVDCTGFGGELGCGCPLLVMKAKLTYSTPVTDAHFELSVWPVTEF